jgi:hypothetical protein
MVSLGLVLAAVTAVAWVVRVEQRGIHTAQATAAAQKSADEAKAKAEQATALAQAASSEAKGGFALLDERLKAMGSALSRMESQMESLATALLPGRRRGR